MATNLEHKKYMSAALDLAAEAARCGDVPVGAIVVDPQGQIIGRGYNQREALASATAHAEIMAIEAACQALNNRRLTGCALYVTMEPCPMCSGAIVLAQLSTLVFGCGDSLWGGCGSIFNIPQHPSSSSKIQILAGIMDQESKELLQAFFKDRRNN